MIGSLVAGHGRQLLSKDGLGGMSDSENVFAEEAYRKEYLYAA